MQSTGHPAAHRSPAVRQGATLALIGRRAFLERAAAVLGAEERHAAERGWYDLAACFRDWRRAAEQLAEAAPQ